MTVLKLSQTKKLSFDFSGFISTYLNKINQTKELSFVSALLFFSLFLKLYIIQFKQNQTNLFDDNKLNHYVKYQVIIFYHQG